MWTTTQYVTVVLIATLLIGIGICFWKAYGSASKSCHSPECCATPCQPPIYFDPWLLLYLDNRISEMEQRKIDEPNKASAHNAAIAELQRLHRQLLLKQLQEKNKEKQASLYGLHYAS
jgi:hypothetical protein